MPGFGKAGISFLTCIRLSFALIVQGLAKKIPQRSANQSTAQLAAARREGVPPGGRPRGRNAEFRAQTHGLPARRLIAPVLANLSCFVQHALARDTRCAQVAHELPAAVDLLALHEARALTGVEVVARDALEHRQVGVEMNFLAPRRRAEAETVDHDERARILDELGGSRGRRSRCRRRRSSRESAALHRARAGAVLERLAQLADDEIFRAAVAPKVQNVVLIARDARVFLLRN